MPSARAVLVHPPVNVQARADTIWAPGAAPCISPPKSPLPAMMPATCVPCDAADDADADEVGDLPLGPRATRREVDVLAVLHDERHPLD